MTVKLTTFTGGPVKTNAYLWPAPKGVICFDAPPGLAEELKRQKIKLAALILTHGHYDHVWDAGTIHQQHDCPVYAHPTDFEMIQNPTYLRRYGVRETYPPVGRLEPLVVPLKGSQNWECAGQTMTLFHIPGHCPGSVVFYAQEAGWIIAGDTLFAGGVGRWDFPLGSREDLVTGIRRHLFALPDKTEVYPGHGPATTIGVEKQTNSYLL